MKEQFKSLPSYFMSVEKDYYYVQTYQWIIDYSNKMISDILQSLLSVFIFGEDSRGIWHKANFYITITLF